MIPIRPKVRGAGTITYRCQRCGGVIEGEARFIHLNGRLVAVHPQHEDPDGR